MGGAIGHVSITDLHYASGSTFAATRTQIMNRPALPRREWMAYAAAFGPTVAAGLAAADDTQTNARTGETGLAAHKPAGGKKYRMKSSINLWALPYPDSMLLDDCLAVCAEAGFDGVELNFDLTGELSAETSAADIRDVARRADKHGLKISGLCSFLFWPHSLTSSDAERRARGRELLVQMIDAAAELETENLLVVPGAVYIPWSPEPEPVPNETCWRRATEAIESVLPQAEKRNVSLNLENIFANAFLMSPAEMNRFVDQFDSDSVGVHFDTGNIMPYQFPEHWIPELGKRIRNVHLKEYSKQAGNGFTLEDFRPLLDGTTNWPAVLDAFESVGYEGYLTFEYFHPYPHHPEALVHHTADAMRRLGVGQKLQTA